MADDKGNVGKADRERVSANQEHEVRAIAEKFGVTRAVAEQTIREHGPMRHAIEDVLGGISKKE